MMDNKLPLDKTARHRSFMAKTQLLDTEINEPSKQGFFSWFSMRKLNKMLKPDSPIATRKHTVQIKVAQTVQPSISNEKKRPKVSKAHFSANILAVQLC